METAVVVTLENYEAEISEGKKRGLLGALQIGRALSRIQSGNLFLSDGCDNFAAYCEKTHGIKRSTAYNMISVYTTWGQKILDNPEFQSVDPSRLIRLLPLTTEVNAEDLLLDAACIPDAAGFENNLRNRRGEVGTDQCDEHDFRPIPWTQCSKCGLRRKIKEGGGKRRILCDL